MEEIQTGLRTVLRFIAFTFLALGFFITGFYLRWRYKDLVSQRKAYGRNMQRFSKVALKIFGIELRVRGEPIKDGNYLYVGNHMGFVDIFIIGSVVPTLFVTSQEMRETPLLGQLCEVGGCIFVERRSRTQIKNELGALVEALKSGLNVVLYPEATSSNGEQILPFKKTLIMSAAHAGKPIQPGCINFLSINGENFNTRTRDHVCWHGDMTFPVAAWNSLSTKSMKAELTFLEPIFASPEEDRGNVAHRAFSIVSEQFLPAKPFLESTVPEAVVE